MEGDDVTLRAYGSDASGVLRGVEHREGWAILPPDPTRCQVCAGEHPPEAPHNPDSLYWQVVFAQEHGRYPTWHDALAHCDQATREAWAFELGAHGIDIEAEYQASLDGAEARRTLRRGEGSSE